MNINHLHLKVASVERAQAFYARFFGSSPWKDGFAAVGNGFGYTFPTSWDYEQGPWMRLDRIFVGAPLRFLNFEVGGRGASDHCPVIADIGLAR